MKATAQNRCRCAVDLLPIYGLLGAATLRHFNIAVGFIYSARIQELDLSPDLIADTPTREKDIIWDS